MSKENHQKGVFENVLKLLRLDVKRFQLMLDLIELIAWQRLKEAVVPGEPTIEERESLTDYIPWNFVPNVDDYGSGSTGLRYKNKIKFKQLKTHLTDIKKILENMEMRR